MMTVKSQLKLGSEKCWCVFSVIQVKANLRGFSGKNFCNLGMPCLGELGGSGEGAGGHEAHAGPEAEIEKPPHQGLGIMGRNFPSSQPSWEMRRTAWVSPRHPAVGCYHGKHPKTQRK